MSKLTKQARGEDCQVRQPLICNHDRETTVCAHVRMIGYSGMGMKANDWFTAFACSACHDWIDGRSPSIDSYETRRLAHLEAVLRTQAIRLQRQHLLSEALVVQNTENT